MCQCEAEVDYVDKEETDYLPEAGKVVAALPLLDMGGGDVVDQVFLFRELASTVAPFASKHTSALNSELLIVNKNHLLDASYSLTQVKLGIPNTCNVRALY